jgi:hypothetical protein
VERELSKMDVIQCKKKQLQRELFEMDFFNLCFNNLKRFKNVLLRGNGIQVAPK